MYFIAGRCNFTQSYYLKLSIQTSNSILIDLYHIYHILKLSKEVSVLAL